MRYSKILLCWMIFGFYIVLNPSEKLKIRSFGLGYSDQWDLDKRSFFETSTWAIDKNTKTTLITMKAIEGWNGMWKRCGKYQRDPI